MGQVRVQCLARVLQFVGDSFDIETIVEVWSSVL
jgi:hypothetical protein